MSFIEAIILGIVQGLTEFLPISSSAHLRVVGELLEPGQEPGAAFTAIVQLGTETAVLIYFWNDITRIIGKWFQAVAGKIPHSDPDVRMGWMVIIGSIPIGVLGLLFEDQIDHGLRNLYITATMLILFGILLGVADRIAPQRKELKDLTVRDGILFGLAQALALIPGVSRSGGTITAGLLMGYTRQAAARYAFLLAVPAVFASGFYKAAQEVPVLLTADGRAAAAAAGEPSLLAIAVATLVSFAVGYVVIVWFMRLIENRSYMPFVLYRVVAGVLLLVLLITGVIDPLAGG
ncbi:undecaprenyl-diphosphatase [Brachybacterium muris]|uniref:undecaprenyl-diphosphate phosphatase n=1 Tax=Brachybacterium muris TaxID=219301 RepID=UPI000DAFDCE5|nr:undecaprenyl-diphosphatase [Brachybacterium muris]MCT1431911.1 undecaprenyl-diphosphate phosphatase [Brachybacterium muris]MCT1654016.1 undecaprenyl-diphosphate phosphatase [Brachybacterium muris]MCT2261333.1 undecaprenyl-diphosphate phosphatase [Brachybacterium muris]PZP17209.1 MAG: undecaprenyl-diphosphatase [Brachybacterium faecium]